MATAISSIASGTSAPMENFAALFEESLTRQEMRQGELITAEVVRVDFNIVVVNAGLKSESFIPIEEFKNDKGEIEVKAGDFVTVAIESLEDGYGETKLSRDKAKRLKAWHDLEAAMEQGTIVSGLVTGKVKGGLTVMVNGIRAFLPGSLVDIRPVKDTTPYENKALEFKVIKLDRKRNNVVVSRRAVLEASLGEEREKLLSTLQEGAIVKGIVKNITDYGAFVDLGGIDGLLHITDLAWRRVKHPSEVLAVGDEVTAKILKFDQEKNRVSLGMKQLGEDPWVGLSRRYPTGHAPVRQGHQHHRLRRVRRDRVGHRGPRARVRDGLDQQEHPSDQGRAARRRGRGDDPRDRRGPPPDLARHEAVHVEPVGRFRDEPQEGRRVTGQIKSITDFGVFVGLPGGIDGLVHLSDLSWTLPGETAVRDYKKGADVEAVVLAIDVERERISLGIKQLDGDPFTNYVATHDKGNVVKGTVKSLDGKGAVIALDGEVEGYLRASEVARDRVEDIRTHLKEGDAGHGDDHQHRPQEPQHQPVDQGEGPRGGDRGDPEHQGRHAGTTLRDDQSRRAAAGQDGQQDHRVSRRRDDQIGADRPPRGAVPAAGRQGCRARGQDDPRRHGREPGEGGAHRDPRVRQLRPELPAAADRTQSEVRRQGAGAGEARPALQGRQGTARAGRLQERMSEQGEAKARRARLRAIARDLRTCVRHGANVAEVAA